MKKLTLALALVFATPVFAADPAVGVWQTEVDDGSYAHIRLAECGNAICGTIARTFNAQGEYDSPNKGKQLVRGMVPQGGGEYKGQVWRPSNNKVYSGGMTVSGDTLRLRGCVAGGLLCAKQTWRRVQ